MGISIAANTLLSRVVRFNASNGATGNSIIQGAAGTIQNPRRLNLLARVSGVGEDGGGGFLDRFFDTSGSLVGFIGRVAGGLGFSFVRGIQWLRQQFDRLYSFNWNATDAQLQSMVESQNVQLAAIWGGVVGSAVGWLGGIAIGAGLAYVVPVVGGALLSKAVISNGVQEIASDLLPRLTQALTQTAGTLVNNSLISGYMGLRSLIKRLPPATLDSIVGAESGRWMREEWGSDGGPNMSFMARQDRAVESIDGAAFQAFIEEFLDEAWDSFTEAGIVVAQEIDDAFQQARLANQNINGPPRTVELTPDINTPNEVLTFEAVPQTQMETAIQTTINTHRQVWSRDLGQIVGNTFEEAVRARPQLRKLTIQFSDVQQPPLRRPDGTRAKRTECSIPDVKLGLTWNEIRLAAQPYMWGKFCARATLDNQRQMAVYGSSAQEAKQALLRLHQLSTAEILRLTVSEEEFVNPRMRKDPTMIYPIWGTFMGRYASLDSEGRTTLDNRTFDEQVIRIPLWVEPSNYTPL